MPIDEKGNYVHPVCQKVPEITIAWFKTVDELDKAKIRRDYLKGLINKAQEELAKEYGVGYIKMKKVRNYRFPVFRSLERGKYSLTIWANLGKFLSKL